MRQARSVKKHSVARIRVGDSCGKTFVGDPSLGKGPHGTVVHHSDSDNARCAGQIAYAHIGIPVEESGRARNSPEKERRAVGIEIDSLPLVAAHHQAEMITGPFTLFRELFSCQRNFEADMRPAVIRIHLRCNRYRTLINTRQRFYVTIYYGVRRYPVSEAEPRPVNLIPDPESELYLPAVGGPDIDNSLERQIVGRGDSRAHPAIAVKAATQRPSAEALVPGRHTDDCLFGLHGHVLVEKRCSVMRPDIAAERHVDDGRLSAFGGVCDYIVDSGKNAYIVEIACRRDELCSVSRSIIRRTCCLAACENAAHMGCVVMGRCIGIQPERRINFGSGGGRRVIADIFRNGIFKRRMIAVESLIGETDHHTCAVVALH